MFIPVSRVLGQTHLLVAQYSKVFSIRSMNAWNISDVQHISITSHKLFRVKSTAPNQKAQKVLITAKIWNWSIQVFTRQTKLTITYIVTSHYICSNHLVLRSHFSILWKRFFRPCVTYKNVLFAIKFFSHNHITDPGLKAWKSDPWSKILASH